MIHNLPRKPPKRSHPVPDACSLSHRSPHGYRGPRTEELENGELLNEAEAAGFELLVTTDKNIRISKTLQAGRSRSSFWAKAGGV
jgi:hypothetical protein